MTSIATTPDASTSGSLLDAGVAVGDPSLVMRPAARLDPITLDDARRAHGAVLDPVAPTVDADATRRLRGGQRMRGPLALAAAVAMLAACTSKLEVAGSAWTRPNTMYQRVTLDEVDCIRKTRELPRPPESWVGGAADLGRLAVEDRRVLSAYERCMTELGYAPAGR